MAKKNMWMLLVGILALVGAVNWVLVGLFNWDLVAKLLGQWKVVASITYTAAGLAGAWIAGKELMK